MDLQRKIYKTSVRGEEVSLEISKMAGQANAAVLGRHGDTAVLATVVMSEEDKSGDFFPLTVDYEERFYAAGKILGSRFTRREGKAPDGAVLSGRVIDRTIRPLFDPRLRREVQVVITVLSYEEKNDPDFIALLSASAALAISDVPWSGPVAGFKISSTEENGASYEAYFAGTEKKINMIEFEGREVSESVAEQVFAECFEEIKRLVDFQKKMAAEIGKPKARVALAEADPKTKSVVSDFLKKDLAEALTAKNTEGLRKKILEELEKAGEDESVLNSAEVFFEEEVDKYVHALAIERGKRADGRKMDEIRDLYAEVGLLRRAHGSALFIRGETQVLAVTTLATLEGKQLVESMEGIIKKRFMLNYNFPGFATGETGRSNKGPGRREIGHGALAAKAIASMLPSEEEFPYAIRVVAETLSSNGSSSMASTCSSSLSLMDAGVPIKKQVAGISIGLMSDESGRYKLLTDIQGPEDHYGDMDFKVAGTRDGINAIQMDVKVDGITPNIFKEALEAAKKARFRILDVMDGVLAKPRAELSPFAPAITTVQIPVDKIGLLIGPGGKTINGLLADAENKISIDIEEDGKVYVAGTDAALVAKTVEIIRNMTKEFQVGEMVEGTVIKVLDFGAIVDLGGGTDGMIHVSELKEGFVKKVEDVVKVGDFVRAKIIRVEDGKIGLSLKQALK